MKKIIIVLTLILSLSTYAQAQKTTTKEITTIKITPENAAKKNVSEINSFTPINTQTQKSLQELFTMKHNMTEDGQLSEERKVILSESIDSQLKTILDNKTYTKIKTNKKLYESLIK